MITERATGASHRGHHQTSHYQPTPLKFEEPAIPGFDDMLRATQRAAFHLETRDTYAGTDADYAAWRAGGPVDRSEGDAEWHAMVRPLVERGVDVRRLRVVSEPVSDYIHWEHRITEASSIAAGELVRWVPRRAVSDLTLPGNDFWLLDDVVVFNHFNGDGAWMDGEVISDPAIAEFCLSAFEALWQRGIDHAKYMAPRSVSQQRAENSMSEAEFERLLGGFRREAVHLEMRDEYGTAVELPHMAKWAAGEPDDLEWLQAWCATLREGKARGKSVRRARIVSEPLSDYQRWSLSIAHPIVAAGEDIRWVPRRLVSSIGLPGNDFYLFDDRLIVFLHYAGDGRATDRSTSTDPSAVRLCRSAFEAVWELAIPHSDYYPD